MKDKRHEEKRTSYLSNGRNGQPNIILRSRKRIWGMLRELFEHSEELSELRKYNSTVTFSPIIDFNEDSLLVAT